MIRHTTATILTLALATFANAQDAIETPDQSPVQVEPGEFVLDAPTTIDFKVAHKPFGTDELGAALGQRLVLRECGSPAR